MTEPLSPDAIRAGIADVLAPIRQQLTQVEEGIETRETELKELRELRTELRAIVGRIDPAVPMKGRASNAKTAAAWRGHVSKERVDQVLAFVREHANGDAFYAGKVAEQMGLHQSGVSAAMRVLADRGLIRLDHVGGHRGVTRFYKLTGASE